MGYRVNGFFTQEECDAPFRAAMAEVRRIGEMRRLAREAASRKDGQDRTNSQGQPRPRRKQWRNGVGGKS